MQTDQAFREQLESLHAISVQIAALRELAEIYDRALEFCLELTQSETGFVGLIGDDGSAMDVVASQGFQPSADFYERFRRMPVRPSVFGVTITEERPYVSNDVENDPLRVGQPPGHPTIRTFLGVPLRVGDSVIGMIGVGNREGGYGADDERLLSTFANQVAVAIDNARLYQRQHEMIVGLQQLQERLGKAEREQLLAQERDRIAAGLHDDIEQQLFMIGMRLSSLLESSALEAAVIDRVLEIRRMASRTAAEVRDVIFALAVESYPGDLTRAIRRLVDETGHDGDFETDLVVTGTPTADLSAIQGALRAVVKEALMNVTKHAEAHVVLVSLRYGHDQVDVVVQDDGIGASDLALDGQADPAPHFGVNNMRHQIEALGGRFEVGNGDESGLVVRASVPLSKSGRDAR